jgi:outer membrane immunogenic protein
MKKVLVALFAAAATLVSGFASAAPPAPPVYSWTGFYVGGSVGERWSNPTWTTNCIGAPCSPPNIFAAFATANPNADFNVSTGRFGGYVGYNLQASQLWVAGVEADFAYGNGNQTMAGIPGQFTATVPPGGSTASIKEGWDGSARARLGFLVTPAVLIYGTGGIAWQHAEADAQCPAVGSGCSLGVADQEAYSTTMVGWTVGGGGEAMLWGNWLVRAEYRYSNYGTLQHAFFANTVVPLAPPGTASINMSAPISTNMATVGLAYKFGPTFGTQ